MRDPGRSVINALGCLSAAAALLATSTGHAQSVGPGASQPVFRASVELVQLDVSVTDRHGAVVPGLGASDFLLKQDGTSIPVRLATFVSGRANQTRFVFFVDDYHLAFENFARLREAVERFTAHGVPYGAEMLVMPASFVGEKAFTFTTNPVAVTMDVAALSWGNGSRRLSRRGAWGSCDNLTNDLRADIFTNGTMGTLTALLNALQQIDGRKAVIVLTDGLVSGCRDEDDVPEHLRRITDIANRGSSVLYGVDTRPFSGGSNLIDDDLHYLADRTGGIAGRSNAIDVVLSRVAADQRGYYLLAYEPPASTFKKGRLQYRDVKVSVTTPDLQVRSRAGFYGVPDAALARR